MKNDKKLCEKLDSLLREGRECEWIEFKKNYATSQEIGKYISALSNSSLLCGEPHGYLVFGIHDKDLKVVGTTFSFFKAKIGEEELESWLTEQINPRVYFQGLEFIYGGKNIVMIKIEAASDTPVAFNRVEYVRIGSHTKKLKKHPEKARKIWQGKNKKAFEEKIAVESIQFSEIFEFLNYPKYFELMDLPLSQEQHLLIDKLNEEKIVKRTSDKTLCITNLGAILFAKDLNKFDSLKRKTVRVIVYKNDNKIETTKEEMWAEGYASEFQELVKYICDQLPINEEIKDSLRREVKVYPEVAIRELVANMLIHQDFSIPGAGPMVEIFNNRIEFSNPGHSLVELMKVIGSTPRSRNETLASIMRRMNVCEERGSGIQKVISSVENYQLPAPKFLKEEQSFRVILYAPKILKEMTQDDRIRACYQHCCLKYISGESMTNQSLRERFRIEKKNYPMASKIISRTLECGLIKSADPFGRSKKMAQYIPFWA